ncbi:MAG TPA: hypothetical protein VF347_01485 [Candidatus Humimicrobiaceae bacterium]
MHNTIKKHSIKNIKRSGIISNFSIISVSMLIILSLLFLATGCSSLLTPASEKIDIAQDSQGGQDSAGGKDVSQETQATEAGEVKIPVDYANAKIGADMVGAIPTVLLTDKDNFIKIEITNTSDFAWTSEGANGVVRLGYHYYGQDVDFTDYDKTARTMLPKVVNPGDTVSVLVLVNDIKNPGKYVIQIDPVLEGNKNPNANFWFSSKGITMIEGLADFVKSGK